MPHELELLPLPAAFAEEPVPPARLAEECEALRQQIPVDGERGTFLVAQLLTEGAGRLLRRWLDHPDRHARVRRLLTEPVLPTDLD